MEEKPLTKPYILDPPSSQPNSNCFGDSECEKAKKVEIHPDPQSSCEPWFVVLLVNFWLLTSIF